jgi:ribonuclease Y
MNLDIIIISIIAIALGATATYFIQRIYLQKKKAMAKDMVEDAKKEVDRIKKDEIIKFKEEMHRKRSKFYDEFRAKENQLGKNESRVIAKEKDLQRRENNLKMQEEKYKTRGQKLNQREESLYEKHTKIDQSINELNHKLEAVSGISVEDAKKELMKNLENQVKLEAAQLAINIKNEARENAQHEAKEIIASAIENLAYEVTMESTLSTVQIPSEKYKGMIIGREGRNIRAFEEIVGIKVIIDDTPELIVLSGFDPIRREVARITLENLIKLKNINPTLIEQQMQKAMKEVDNSVIEAADQTINELKLNDIHPKIKENIGKLKYRYSYGQNILNHSKEVAFLAGSMAVELGFNVKLAKRAGLLHDIGKALTVNAEGSHVQLGVELCKKYNEHEVVINSILAHHEEEAPISPISVLVTAADKISGSRPGARRDTLEAYTKRITSLEEIANSFDGVSKTYAISAGREIRVIVEPENISDKHAEILASDISNKIKESMEFPGQIKVCVIRQSVASKFTNEFGETKIEEEKIVE